MNKFDEKYDIRLAKADETDEIMFFLDKHWKKGHILSKNKELFNYEFLDKDNTTLHIIKYAACAASFPALIQMTA